MKNDLPVNQIAGMKNDLPVNQIARMKDDLPVNQIAGIKNAQTRPYTPIDQCKTPNMPTTNKTPI
jgi:hypothetical protein